MTRPEALLRCSITLAVAFAACGDDASSRAEPDAGAELDASGAVPMDLGRQVEDGRAGRDADAQDGRVEDAGGCSAREVHLVTGHIVDERDTGVEGAAAQLCARIAPDALLMCLEPAFADASGAFAIEVPGGARCIERAALRVRLPGTATATTYCTLSLASLDADGTLALAAPFVLFTPEPAASLPPEGDPDEVRTVVLGDGLELDLAPSALGPGADYTSLGARRVPLDAPGLCFLDAAPGLLGIYAFSPESTLAGAGASLRIPNATGLAPGSRVELWLLGGLDSVLPDGRLIEEAAFEPFGEATVGADGAFIVTPEGAGLPYLSWLGYREAR